MDERSLAETVPVEIVAQILSLLSAKRDLACATLVCRHFQHAFTLLPEAPKLESIVGTYGAF